VVPTFITSDQNGAIYVTCTQFDTPSNLRKISNGQVSSIIPTGVSGPKQIGVSVTVPLSAQTIYSFLPDLSTNQLQLYKIDGGNSAYELLAGQGAQGAQGLKGDTGPQGSVSLPDVIFIPADTVITSYFIDLSNISASTRFVIRKNSQLDTLTFGTSSSTLPQTNYYIYLKNLGTLDVNVYHAPGFENPHLINSANQYVDTSIIYKPTANQNSTFQYIFWDGTDLCMV
jgi:hypothetical protein